MTTPDEHRARAMLLGYRGYNARLGYYFRFIDVYPRYEYLDSRTLQPITHHEKERRDGERYLEGSSEYHKPWYDDG